LVDSRLALQAIGRAHYFFPWQHLFIQYSNT